MKKIKRNLVTIDLSDCKNLNECAKVIDMLTSNCIKISVKQIKIPLSN